MNQTVFGIVGGYGSTGRAVVSELRRCPNAEILIGGRDLAKAKALAGEFDSKVIAAQVDALDARSLDDFCDRCSVVINCVGPVMALQDRVAQAAYRRKRHYIDVAALSAVDDRMLPHDQEIADLGLSFVLSAGWMPGLTELLPVYAHHLARTRMKTIDSVTLYFGDSGEWSTNALRDVAWFLHQSGLRRPAYCHKGNWTRATLASGSCEADLGSPIGSRRFTTILTPELMAMGRRLNDCDVFTYSYLSGLRIALAGALIAVLPLPEDFSVRLLRYGFRRTPLPVGGFVVVRVQGHSDGGSQALTVQVVYEKQQEYRINGLVPSIAACMISKGKGVERGVHFLADAVDPIAFLAEMKKASLDHLYTFEPS